MIYKQKDSSQARIEQLEERLRSAQNNDERRRFEKDLAILRAGEKGERDTAYLIDFELKDSKNWAVIHDLRIEHNGRVAQIDHILINRLLEIYVVESKSFRLKVRHANGGWERLNFNHWEGIPSPTEQNERHIFVLTELIRDKELSPARFGLSPKYYNVVAVQPSCSIVGQFPSDTRIFRTDSLVKKVLESEISPFGLLRVISPETLQAFAEALALYHEPLVSKEQEKETSSPLAAPTAAADSPGQSCDNCRGSVTAAEVKFSRLKKAAFAGQVLCRKCQTYVSSPPAAAPAPSENGKVAARCAQCGEGVDSKVVAFCRFQSKRFGGRVLCRTCQSVN